MFPYCKSLFSFRPSSFRSNLHRSVSSNSKPQDNSQSDRSSQTTEKDIANTSERVNIVSQNKDNSHKAKGRESKRLDDLSQAGAHKSASEVKPDLVRELLTQSSQKTAQESKRSDGGKAGALTSASNIQLDSLRDLLTGGNQERDVGGKILTESSQERDGVDELPPLITQKDTTK